MARILITGLKKIIRRAIMKNIIKKALLVFSHEMTENQEKELNEVYNVEKIEKLPKDLQEIWSNVSIENNYKENFNENDVILIQGNWGYTYSLVKWSIEKGLIPVYSYTERNVEEIKDGENVKKISYFKHVKFLEYNKLI